MLFSGGLRPGMGSRLGVVLSWGIPVLNQHQSGLHWRGHQTWHHFSAPCLDPKNKPRGDSGGGTQVACQNMAWAYLFIAEVRNMTWTSVSSWWWSIKNEPVLTSWFLHSPHGIWKSISFVSFFSSSQYQTKLLSLASPGQSKPWGGWDIFFEKQENQCANRKARTVYFFFFPWLC